VTELAFHPSSAKSFLSIRPIAFVNGILILILGVAMLLPMTVDLVNQEPNAQAFIGSAFICFVVGGGLAIAHYSDEIFHIKIRSVLLLSACSWISVFVFSALPFLLSSTVNSFADAMFESISSLTTTGFTIYSQAQGLPKSIVLWRATLQWLGGVGIVLMALLVVPVMHVSGIQGFYTDAFQLSEKVLPRLSHIIRSLLAVYGALTFCCTLTLWLCGISFFESICYAMSVVSTSGAPVGKNYIQYLNDPLIPWVIIVFMFLSALPFFLFIKAVLGQAGSLLRDTQIRVFAGVITVATIIASFSFYTFEMQELWSSIRNGSFYVISMATTTGLPSEELREDSIRMLFAILGILGGCTGSTAGGIKMFRLVVIIKVIGIQLKKIVRPHGVFVPLYGQKSVSEQTVSGIFSLLALYFVCFMVFALGFTFEGLDITSAMELSVNTLSNAGTVFFPADFQNFSLPAKWFISLGMFLGRLEFTALLVFFSPWFWRR
jgi:trk system potassium uptake protein TrkH